MPYLDSKYTGSPHVVLIKQLIDNAVNEINTIIPGRVTSYNKETGRARVQVLNKVIFDTLDENGDFDSADIPPLDNVPVCFFGSAKSLKVVHEVKVGDTGLLLCCQRSIDEFKATNPETPEQTRPYRAKDIRKFDINDALFFPIYLSGNKNFEGMQIGGSTKVGKEGAGLTGNFKVESERRISLVGGKGKPTQVSITQVVEDLQSQINTNSRNIKTVAGSNPWTAPSLGSVLPLDILGKIKHGLNYAKQKLSFADPQVLELAGALFSAGLKALKVEGNEIIRENPMAMASEMLTPSQPVAQVVLQQQKIYTAEWGGIPRVQITQFQGNITGWYIGGLSRSHHPAFTLSSGLGEADFSSFTRVDKNDLGMELTLKEGESIPTNNPDLLFSDTVAVIFTPRTSSNNIRINFLFLKSKDFSRSSVRNIKAYVPDAGDSVDDDRTSSPYSPKREGKRSGGPAKGSDTYNDILIGNFNLGSSARTGSLQQGSLHSLQLTSDSTPNSNNQDLQHRESGWWSNLVDAIGGKVHFEVIKLRFFDANGNEIVIPKDPEPEEGV